MKKSLFFFTIFLYSAVFNSLIAQLKISDVMTQQENYFDVVHEVEKDNMAVFNASEPWEQKRYIRWKTFWDSRIDQNGSSKTFNEKWLEMFNAPKSQTTSGLEWKQLGPFEKDMSRSNYIGHVECIASDPNNPDVIYIGGQTSGLWRSTNMNYQNTHWECLTNNIPGIGIEGIAVDPTNSNIIYIATGMYSWYSYHLHPSGYGNFGLGILKTIDGGQHWYFALQFTPENAVEMEDIQFYPESTDSIYALSKDSIYISPDTGNTWQRYPLPNDLTTIGNDTVIPQYWKLTFNKNNPQEIYATGQYALAHSLDGGVTWTNMYYDLPVDSEFIYAMAFNYVDNHRYIMAGKHLYVDSSDTWIQVVVEKIYPTHINYYHTFTTANYVVDLFIAPNGIIYAGGVILTSFSTQNVRGDTIAIIEGMQQHDDTRDVIFPNDSTDFTAYFANDGGIYGRKDTISNWGSFCGDLNVNQFLNIGITEANPNLLLTGGGDVGTWLRMDNRQWKHVIDGDGGPTTISRIDPNIMFGTCNGCDVTFVNPDGSPSSLTTGFTSNSDINLNSPVLTDPHNSAVVYAVGHTTGNPTGLYRNNNYGLSGSWTNIFSNNVYDIDISYSNPDEIVFAKSVLSCYYIPSTCINDGALYISKDAGDNYVQLTNPEIDSLFLYAPTSDIKIDPYNEDHFWVTFSRFANGKKVYETTDGGQSFTNITYNLPNIPVQCIQYDNLNKRLYLGTDFGIYFKDDGTNYWVHDDSFNIFTSDIKINHFTNEMYVSTWGRGIWQAKLPCSYDTSKLFIAQDTTWEYDNFLNRDIVVLPGHSLTIKGKLAMTSQAGITVEKSAKLILYGATLTNSCGDSWQGITVKGNDTLAQTAWNQGAVYLWHGATIENALTAVKVDGGGVIRATNSIFRNNISDVVFNPYLDTLFVPSDTTHNRSFFTNCQFLTDDNTKLPSSYHVYMNGVSGIIFKGNRFENSRAAKLHANYRGIGILSQNAQFKVLPGCSGITQFGVPCPNPVRNTFKGLYYGIKAGSVTGAEEVYIQQADFEKNYRGILLENLNNPTVISNQFDAGYTGAGTDLYQTYPSYYGNSTYSMYLNACTGYAVEENTLQNGDGGLYIYYSGDSSNVIYKNSFANVNHINEASALTAMGNNHSYNGIYHQGLEFICNNFSANQYNMSVVGNSTINKYQGSNVTSTGNVSAHVHTNDEYEFFVDLNSPLNYSYYWYPQDSSEYLYYHTDTLYKFTLLDANHTNECLSHNEIQPHPISVIQSQRLTLANEVINLQNQLTSLVDGGDTQALLTLVSNLQNNNFNQTCNELLNIAPYVSDTVLVLFMSKDINGHADKKRDVLLSNSPLPEHAKAALADYWLPSPFKEQVLQAQNGINAITAKEMEIANLKVESQRLLYRIVAYGNFMADTLPAYRDSVMTILNDEQGFGKDRFLIPPLIKQGQYDVATNAINDLETYANTLPDMQRNNLLDYCNYLKIVKRYVQTNYGLDIIKQYRPVLEQWAKQDNSAVQIPAQILLEQTYPQTFDYPEKIELPQKNMNKSMFLNNSNILSDKSSNNEMLFVYPNPAKDIVTVEYVLNDNTTKEEILLLDVEGHLLKRKSVYNTSGVITIDLSDLSAGTYIISLKNSKKYITNIK